MIIANREIRIKMCIRDSSKSMTVKAIAERDGKTSAVTTLDYIIAPVAVQADKPAGTYDLSLIHI